MTTLQAKRLAACEEVIDRGLRSFIEIGNALRTIRDEALYKATHDTFAAYCKERFQFAYIRAWRLIQAASLVKALPPGIALPDNESQVRPFIKLSPDSFPKLWEETLRRSKGKPSCTVAESVVNGRSVKPDRQSKEKTSTLQLKAPIGRILSLLAGIKKKIEQDDKEGALADVESVEELLFAHVKH